MYAEQPRVSGEVAPERHGAQRRVDGTGELDHLHGLIDDDDERG